MHPDVAGTAGAVCPECGMPLERGADLQIPETGRKRSRTTIEAKIRTQEPLTVGRPVKVWLSLRDKISAEPITLAKLREVHTQKIHLLIIDSSLTDYHHEHPAPESPESGEYVFTFTPAKPGPYRLWADLQPWSTNLQEYAVADIPADVAGEEVTEIRAKLQASVGSYHFELSLSPPEMKALEVTTATVRVYDAEGKPFDRLEPVMGTYAHLVGFYGDRKNVVHCHPAGKPPVHPEDRGGPELKFRFGAIRPGLIRFFCQVQINDKSIFAPFSVIVADNTQIPKETANRGKTDLSPPGSPPHSPAVER